LKFPELSLQNSSLGGRRPIIISWHRFYSPETGRYVSADPIGLDGGINLFAYVKNNPVLRKDPTGLYVEVGVRTFYPYSVPYARHCFVRFNGDMTDTISYDNKGFHPDPNPGIATYSKTTGSSDCSDSCVRNEVKKCKGSDYSFTAYNCCMCVSNALKACGLKKEGPWPNSPYDASSPPYTIPNTDYSDIPIVGP
jgi:uncharacterized protein RhaS with RHS repeats